MFEYCIETIIRRPIVLGKYYVNIFMPATTRHGSFTYEIKWLAHNQVLQECGGQVCD